MFEDSDLISFLSFPSHLALIYGLLTNSPASEFLPKNLDVLLHTLAYKILCWIYEAASEF